MKKLRLIVTLVIVLVIVGSISAFKFKAGAYCVVTVTDSANNCTMIIHAKQVVAIGGTLFKYATWWDGDPIKCTAANNGLCTAGPVRFSQD
jgi:hypothetical protein